MIIVELINREVWIIKEHHCWGPDCFWEVFDLWGSELLFIILVVLSRSFCSGVRIVRIALVHIEYLRNVYIISLRFVCFFWGFWGSGLFWGSLRSLRFKVVVFYIFGVLMSRSFCSGVRIVRIALVSIEYLRFRVVVYYIWCVDVPIVLQCQDSGLLWCV